MPLNQNESLIPSTASKMTKILGFKELHDVDQLVYHPFRFKSYRLSYDGRDYYAFPLCRPDYEPEFPNEDVLTGRELLVSLCNLAMEINCFDTKESCAKLIVRWCIENMHPYDIDFIYSELVADHFDISTIDGHFVEKDGIFGLNKFIDDLDKLYNAAMFYEALEGICVTDDDLAYDLGAKGRCFDGYSNQPLVGEFTNATYNHYEILRKKLVECVPNFMIRLKVDPITNRLNFSTDVKSVFDIAWFTLARMLSEYPTPEDKVQADAKPEGIMIQCRHCGKFLIRKNNRQEYCDSDDCQKVRSARKQKAYRDRKATQTVHAKKKA